MSKSLFIPCDNGYIINMTLDEMPDWMAEHFRMLLAKRHPGGK